MLDILAGLLLFAAIFGIIAGAVLLLAGAPGHVSTRMQQFVATAEATSTAGDVAASTQAPAFRPSLSSWTSVGNEQRSASGRWKRRDRARRFCNSP